MNSDSRWLVLAGALVGVAVGMAFALASRSDAVRVLPLGDSITEGRAQRPSYRPELWRLLQRDGCDVDFIGSARGPGRSAHLDNDHEGHWGWRTDQIAAALPAWLDRRTPDIALVHLGSNDVMQDVPTEQAVAQLRRIVAQLREANPRVLLLLAQIIPIGAEHAQRVRALNTAIADLAQDENGQTSPILLVDQHAGYDPALNYDGIHPDARGAERIARRWHSALRAVLGDRCRAGRAPHARD